MVFIDASFYLSLLNPQDNNHQKAMLIAEKYKNADYITSYMVLGELLTVASMRYDKELAILFVEKILKSRTKIIMEKKELIKKAFDIFKQIRSKNISWVDCYSLVLMKKLKIKKALTFDRHFKKLGQLK